jgi:hypothetical protein
MAIKGAADCPNERRKKDQRPARAQRKVQRFSVIHADRIDIHCNVFVASLMPMVQCSNADIRRQGGGPGRWADLDGRE